MKKTFKKIKKAISLIVVSTMLTSIIPVNIFGNYQSPVTETTIQNDGTAAGGTYNIKLNWPRPLYNSKNDTAIINGDETDRSYSYKIEWRNGTSNENYGNAFETVDKTSELALTKGFTANLDSGSIYSFKVTPSHTNTYEQTVDGEKVTYENKAPLDTTIVPAEALYMTDIKLSSESKSGGLYVTWDNPTYLGSNVFTGYRLYYELGGSSAIFSAGSDYLDVKTTDKDIVSNGDGTISYLFNIPDVEIGKLYALKIEPLYGTAPVKTDSVNKVSVGGKNYSFAYSNNEYRADDAYVKAGLYLKEEGLNYIRLYWDSLSSITSVTKVEVWTYPNGNLNNPIQLGVISGSDASNINYWLADKPSKLTGYKIVITHADGTMESNIVYYDPSYKEFEPYKPIIRKAETSNVPDIDLYWQAFLRTPYSDEEKNAVDSKYNKFLDENIKYKIWVTDDLNNFTDTNFDKYFLLNEKADMFNKSNFEIGVGQSTLVYNTLLSNYYSFENGVGTLKKIVDNKIYYIKIQATRILGDETSKDEFYSVFVPPNSEIITIPVTMSNPPLRILKDEKGLEVITENSIGIEWSKNWYEIYDKDSQNWNSVVGVNSKGKIVFGDTAKNLEDTTKIFNLYEFKESSSLDDVKNGLYNKLISAGAVDSTSKPYSSIGDLALDFPIRAMAINNANYEIFTTPLDYVEKNGGYEEFLSTIVDLDTWVKIPSTTDNPQSYIVKDQQAPTAETLTENTAYVIYFRSYVLDASGKKIYSYYPSYVMANTLKTSGSIDIKPPTQLLEVVEPITDTSITVRWPYSTSFVYELKYSDKVIEYSAGGTTVNHEDIITNGTIKIESDGKEYIYYNVKKLFPNTNYYFWIQATGGTNKSGYSPAVTGKTDDLETPPIPRGLGLIGLKNLEIINAANNTNLLQKDVNYLIVEWLRDSNDSLTAENGIIKLDGGEFLTHPNIVSTYAAKFNDLQGNKKYYVRVKSRVSVSKTDGVKKYSYVVSLADNPQFTDEIKFEVPNYGLVDNGLDVLVRESDWCTFKSFTTGKNTDEFDGEFDPTLYPLPEQNYEVTYEKNTDTLTYELRGEGKDSFGVPNHGVDNRFISQLIKDNIYDFAIDVSLNDGKNISNRKVVLPYSILNSLGESKTSLTIKADNVYTKFDLSMIKDIAKENNVSDFGKGSKLILEFKETLADPNLLDYGEKYISKPQKLTATLLTNTRSIDISKFSKPVEVGIAISNRYLAVDHNIQPYFTDENNENWVPIKSKYNSTINKFTFDTSKTGTFTVIGKEAPRATEDSITNGSSKVVSNFMNFTDLPYYTASDKITANQFNKIISAVAKGKDTVTINEVITQDEFTQLGRGKLLVSGSYVTREKGIASLVRLYELKTKRSLNKGNDIGESGFTDFTSVGSDYKIPIEKAIELGMLDLDQQINPQGEMTFGEFMYMLEFIVTE